VNRIGCWQIGWLVALMGCATSQPSHFIAWTIVEPASANTARVEGKILALQGGVLRTEKMFDAALVSFDCRWVSPPGHEAVLTVASVNDAGERQVLAEVRTAELKAPRSWATVRGRVRAPGWIELEARPSSARWEIRNFVVK
jgi:hypothetical protein